MWMTLDEILQQILKQEKLNAKKEQV